jgi:hypothetical protein
MRQNLLLSLFLILLTAGFSQVNAQTTLRQVDFQSASNFTVDVPEFVTGGPPSNQFFSRFTSASEGTSHDLGAAGVTPITGTEGTSYFAIEFSTPEHTITTNAVSTTGFNTITLKYLLAAPGSGYDAGSTGAGDWIIVEYSWDGGAWNTLIGYAGFNTGNVFNTDPNLDFDGADGTTVSANLTDNTSAIPKGASDVSLSVRFRTNNTAAGEEYVLDNIRITGVADAVLPVASAPTSAAQTLKGGTLSTSTVQSTKAGNIYMVKNGEAATTVAEILTAIAANKAFLAKSSAVAATPYTVTPTSNLLSGVYDIVAVDNANNVSTVVGGWLTVDNTPPTPSAPTSTTQFLKTAAVSTSTIQSNDAGTIYLVLNGELASTVAEITTAISANKGFIGKSSAVANTPYTVTIPASLTDGVYNIIAADVLGNVSSPLAGWLNVDNTAPTNQNLVFAASTSAQSGGTVTIASSALNSGLSTDNVWLAPTGTSSFTAGATMTTAGGSATSILAPATASTYKLFVIDAAGNISVESTATLTIDNGAPTASAPTSTAQTLKSGSVSTSTVQLDEAGNIYLFKTGTSVTTQAQINTAISGNNAFLGKGSAAANTPYTVTLAASLNSGVYDIIGVDIAGNISNIVSGWLTVDNAAPTASAPTSTAQTLKSGTTSTSTVQSNEPGNIYLVKNGVAATTQAQIDAAITANNAFLGQASAAMNTAYTVTPAASLNNGVYDIYAVDNAGNVSTGVGGWLTVDNTAPTNQNLVFASNVAAAPGGTVTIASSVLNSGLASDVVWLAPSGTTTFIAGANMTQATGSATSILAPVTEGDYKLFVLDAAGNISTASTATLSVFTQASISVFNFIAPGANTQLNFTWTAGTGGNRLITIEDPAAAAAPFTPVNGTTYTPNLAFGTAPDLNAAGAGTVRAIYDGTGSALSGPVTGLTAGTQYTVKIYEYKTGRIYLTPPTSASRLAGINGTNPTTAATNMTFSNVTGTSMDVQFTQGNGSSSMLVARAGGAVAATPPTDGITYSANTNFSLAVDQGGGNKIIAYRTDAASGTPITITGLSPDVVYHFAVYELNSSGTTTENYSTVNLTGNRSTEPSTQTSGLTFTGVTETGMTLNWSGAGNGDGRVVVMRSGSAVATDPTDNTTYSANANFNFGVSPAGSAIGAGYLVFDATSGTSVALTNLLPGTTYHFAVYEYNNTTSQSAPNKVYLTPAATANQATNADATAPVPPALVGAVTVTGGTVSSGYWNATQTTGNSSKLNVVVPLTTADGTLDGGHVQVRLKMTGGAFADIPGTGSSTITNAERVAGTKTVQINAADVMNVATGFTEGNVSGSSASETKFMIITAKAYDLAGNASADYTQSTTQTDVDLTPPTIVSSSFFNAFDPATDASFTTCNGSAVNTTSTREYVHILVSEALNITNGAVVPTIPAGSTGFAASAGTFSACSNRGGTVYHNTNIIHLEANFFSTGPNVDGAWDGNTTFSFTAGGTIVKDLAGNEMATVPSIVPGDNTPPALATGLVFNPNGAGPETITFQLDETLNAAVTNNVTGFTVSAAGLNTGLNNYTSGTKTVTLTSTSDGQWTDAVTVSYSQGTGNVTDPANNEMVAFGGAAPAAAEPIFLTSVHIEQSAGPNVSYANAGKTITLTFNVARALASALPTTPTVKFYTNTAPTTLTGPVGSTYTATLLMTAGMTESVVPFQIVADEADKSTTVTATTDGSSVTFDNTPPAKPALPDLATGSDTGSSSTDNYTATNASIVFSGAASSVENNSTVKLYHTGSTLIGTTTATGTGAWTITVPTLADGTYSITAQSNDAAGNLSTVSDPLSVTIDSSTPAAPATFDLDDADDTGVSATDNITKNTNNLTITGTSENSTSVTIYVDGSPVTTVTSDGSGVWTTDITLTAGTHAINAKQTDLAGNTSAFNGTSLSITVDTTAPSVAALIPDLDPSDDSGQSSIDNITNITSNLTFSSNAAVEANAFVQLFDGASGLTTVQANGTGVWTNDISLSAGSAHTVTFKLTDAAGNTSVSSGSISVTVDNTAPSITPITIISNNTTNTAFAKPGNTVTVAYTTNETLASAVGWAPAYTIDTKPTSNVLTGPTNYSFNAVMTTAYTEGVLAFSITVYDVAGNQIVKTATTNGSSVTFDNTPPSPSTIDINPALVTISNVNGSSASTLTWTVIFNDIVTGVDASDFDLVRPGYPVPATSASDLTFTTPLTVTGSGNTRTVKLDGVLLQPGVFSSDAQLYINLNNDGTIVDGAGNSLTSGLSSTIAYPGDATPGIGHNNDYYTILHPEPVDAATNLQLTAVTPYSFSVSFDQAATPPDFYFFQIRKNGDPTFLPVRIDGTWDHTFFHVNNPGPIYVPLSYSIQNVADGGYSPITLNSGVKYDFKVISTSYSGQYNSDDILDYLTSSTLDGSFTTSTAQSSTIASANLSTTISTLVDDTPAGQFQNIATFTIDDDGAADGDDDAPLKFSTLYITPGGLNTIANWTQAIAGAELTTPSGGTVTGAVEFNTLLPGASSIKFTGFASAVSTDFGHIANDGSKTYTLRIWLKSSLGGTLPSSIDGQKFDFALDATNFTFDNGANQLSSKFAASQAPTSGAVTVDVPTEGFSFVTQPVPTTTLVLKNFTTSPIVHAVDRNGNRDRGFTGATNNVTVTNTGGIAMNPGGVTNFSITPALGIITFPANFQYTGSGDGTLTVTRGGINSNSAAATTGSSPCSTVTVNYSNLSTITTGTGVTRVLSTVTASPGTPAFTFTYNDDGGLGLGDGADTKISQIVITPDASNELDWSLVIAGATLSDGTNPAVAATSITASGITFSGPTFTGSAISTVTDGGASASKTYTLRVWFYTSLGSLAATADQDHLVFSMSTASPANLTLLAASSQAPAAAAVNSVASNGLFEVDATLLEFTSDFSGVLATTPVPPAANAGINFLVNTSTSAQSLSNPVVQAVDANGNRDTDYSATVTTTAAGGMSLSNALTSIGSGIGTFSGSFAYGATGNGKLTVTTATANRVGATPLPTTAGNAQAVTIKTGTAASINSPSTSTASITSITTASPGSVVFTFSITDDPIGTPALQNDGNPTRITDLIISGSSSNNTITDWSQVIAGARLEDNADNTKFVTLATAPGTNTLTFTGLPFASLGQLGFIDDDQTKTFNLRIWLKTDLSGINNYNNTIDGLKFGFDVLSANVFTNSTGTSLLSGQNANTTNVSTTVSVSATQLDFTAPASATPVSINTFYVPALKARDANGNLDTGFGGTITEFTNASGVTMTSTPAIVGSSFSGGLFTFPSDFQFTSGDNNNDVTFTIKVGAIANIPVSPGPAPYTPVLTLKTNTITAGVLPEPSIISSLSTNAAAPVPVFDFVINDDDNQVSGTDALPTKISKIIITQLAGLNDISDWTDLIASATLSDGIAANNMTVTVGAGVNATNITFSGMTNTAGSLGYITDNLSKTYTLSIVLKSALGGTLPASVDNLNLAFEVLASATNIVVASGSSTFGTVNSNFFKENSDPTSVGNNAIQVLATKLKWTTNPTGGSPSGSLLVNKDISQQAPVPVIEALDGNNNRDLNYTTSLNITTANAPPLPLSSGVQSNVTTFNLVADGSAPLTGGIYTFPNDFQFESIGNGTMTAVPTAATTVVTTHPERISTAVTVRVGNSSTITAGAGAEPGTISSLVNASPGVQVFDFNINDDPGSTPATENDGVPTQVTGLYITYGSGDEIFASPAHDWIDAIAGATLTDDDSPTSHSIPVTAIASSYLYFDLSSVTGQALGLIPDNTTKNFKLNIWLKTNLGGTLPITIDGLHFVFDVQQGNTFVSANGSSILTSPYQEQNSGSGNNMVTVDATKLEFSQLDNTGNFYVPYSMSNWPLLGGSINTPFVPNLGVEAHDANGNRDLGFNGTITAFSVLNSLTFINGPLTSPSPVFNAGTYKFPAVSGSEFQYTSGDNQDGQMTMTAGGLMDSSPSLIIKSSFESSLTFNSIAPDPTIDYLNYQGAILTTANSVILESLTLTDGDADGDTDGANTTLNSFTVSITNPTNLKQIALFDAGGVKIPGTEQTVNGASTINFTSLSIIALDANAPTQGTKNFTIRASFNSASANVHDHDLIQLQITAATLGGGSKFLNDPSQSTPVPPGYIGGVLNGDISPVQNIEVTATKLDFTTQAVSAPFIAGINVPIAQPVVQARDVNQIVDIDYDISNPNTSYQKASIATYNTGAIKPLSSLSYNSFDFSQGVLNFTGLQYATAAGEGSLRVTTPTGLSSASGGSASSSHIDVLHVTGIKADQNIYSANNLIGGAVSKVIFGVTFDRTYTIAGQPKLNKFVIKFSNSITNVLTNLKVFESPTVGYFPNTAKNVKTDASINATLTPTGTALTVDFTSGTPRDLSNGPLTYFLMVDVDPSANAGTPKVRPYVADDGTVSDINVETAFGSQFVDGSQWVREYNFAAILAPVLTKSYPASGQVNIDATQDTLSLVFSAPVWSMDSVVQLYRKSQKTNTSTFITTLRAKNGLYDLERGVLAGNETAPYKPLKFFIPNNTLQADSLYYVTIAPGVFIDSLSLNNKGIMDEGKNLFGGISYQGTLFFKTSDNKAPALLYSGGVPAAAEDPQIRFITPTTAIFSGIFNKQGKAYYMVVKSGDSRPTTAQVRGLDLTYPNLGLGQNPGSSIVAIDSFDISQINTISQSALIKNLSPSTSYDIWVCSTSYKSKRGKLTAIPTNYPYDNLANGFAVNAVSGGPTLSFTTGAAAPSGPAIVTNVPSISVCANSYQELNIPITIAEGHKDDFNGIAGTVTLNILAPSGFLFNTKAVGKVVVSGPDVVDGSGHLSYINTTIAKITYDNNGTGGLGLDMISISGLTVISTTNEASGSIIRFGGTAIPNLADEVALANIATYAPGGLDFTNSYSVNVYNNNLVTSIPDNYNATSGSSVELLPIAVVGDFGTSKFTGSGVNVNQLSLTAVTPGTPFNITLTHTDNNGCTTENSVQYTVYDHTKAIPALNTKYCIANNSFPAAAATGINTTKIPFNTLPGYYLYNIEAAPLSTSSFINGAEWTQVIKLMPDTLFTGGSPRDPGDNPVPGQLYYDFAFDNASLLNASNIVPGAVNPYEFFKSKLPTDQGNYYYAGGSLGTIKFTATYQSKSNSDLILPLEQDVEFFLPAIPIVESGIANRTFLDTVDVSNPVGAPGPVFGDHNKGTAVYCQEGGQIDLNGYPRADNAVMRLFKLVNVADNSVIYDPMDVISPPNGFVDNKNGTASIDPTKFTNNYQDIKVIYIYKDKDSPAICETSGYAIIRISPNPIANFTFSTLCESLPIQFTDGSSVTTAPGISITKWAWDFADANSPANTSDIQNPVHIYGQFGSYPNVKLDVTTNVGCKSVQPKTENFQVGGTPDVDFTFKGVSVEDSITFNSTSRVFNDQFKEMSWSFGDNRTSQQTFTDADQPSNPSADFIHSYKAPNQYTVTLTVISKIGCFNSKAQDIIVLGRAKAPYIENFETANKMWQASAVPTSSMSTNPPSWQIGVPGTSVINIPDPSVYGTSVAKTNLTGNYNPLERSAFYSPSIDMSELSRPMISFNSFTQMETSDGVVLQYSVDDKNVADPNKKWEVIGAPNEGFGWFTDQGITAKPGNQPDKDFGWSGGSTTSWTESKHSLSNENNKTPIEGQSRVVFRFALASAKQEAKDILHEGFAIDNVRIGNRTRIVLLENFRNLGNADKVERAESDSLKVFNPSGTDSSLVKLNYHVAFPNTDPFNLDNQQDPGARALYYGIDQTPRVRMDGVLPETENPLFTSWGRTTYSVTSLKLADAKIVPQILTDTDGNGIGIKINVTALKNLGPKTILHIAIVEKSISIDKLESARQALVKTGETNFEYVVKKMLPDAAGTRFNVALEKDATRTFPETDMYTWPSLPIYSPQDLAVVVFLQDEMSKEVFQTEIVDLKDPAVVTGIPDQPEVQFSVYPNPADHEFTIVLPKPVHERTALQVFDQLGKVMLEANFEKGESRKTINTSEYSGGVYLIQMKGEKGMLRHKVMVMHRN